MERFARIIVGYHGCTERFASSVLAGVLPVTEWRASANSWDWLGHGIYFWEHSPERALRWAQERYQGSPDEKASVLAAMVNLGRCFDLLDESFTALLANCHRELERDFAEMGRTLPVNSGEGLKRRELDCLVINRCLDELHEQGIEYDTVRAAFLEGPPAYPGAGFSRDGHIQVSVRNPAHILGVFRPNHAV